MKRFPFILAGAVAVVGALVLVSSAASAAPGLAAGASALDTSGESLIVQVQRGARGMRGGRGGGRVIVRRGGRGIGGAGAAAIGLGMLGAAIAAGAAQSAQPGYYGQCWVERRPVHDRWGNFLGYRRVRLCN